MTVNFIKKKLNKAKQMISERVGTAKRTEFGEDFKIIDSTFHAYQDLFESLSKLIKYMLYPNRADKIVTNTTNRFKNAKEQKYYPHPEHDFSEMCLKFSKALSELPISPVLLEFSDTYATIVQYKHGLEQTLKKGFLHPLKIVRINELERILKSRKKLENYRLEYDALKRSNKHSNSSDDGDRKMAKRKFYEKKDEVFLEMKDFLSKDDTLFPALLKLTQTLMEYHQLCAEEFQDLSSRIKTQGHKTLSSSQGEVHELSEDENDDEDNLETKPCCEVLENWKASHKDDLQVSAGDIVYLIEQVDDVWFYGEFEGNYGYIGVNCVDVLVPLI